MVSPLYPLHSTGYNAVLYLGMLAQILLWLHNCCTLRTIPRATSALSQYYHGIVSKLNFYGCLNFSVPNRKSFKIIQFMRKSVRSFRMETNLHVRGKITTVEIQFVRCVALEQYLVHKPRRCFSRDTSFFNFAF